MPEIYKKTFSEMINNKIKTNYNFFDEYSEIVNGSNFKYLVCNIDKDILKVAIDLAKEKSKFTMSQNQACIPRDAVTKLEKSAQGILAEMFIHILLVEKYGFEVFRYDLERESFVYKNDEYDLKIYISNNYYEIESRSSNIHHTSIPKFVTNDVIIGPYGNSLKITDKLADFHFRPIYMPRFSPFVEKDGKYYYDERMLDGTLKLVITGVATKEDFLNFSYKTTLGQRGTMYYVVDADKIGDIIVMDKKLKAIKK